MGAISEGKYHLTIRDVESLLEDIRKERKSKDYKEWNDASFEQLPVRVKTENGRWVVAHMGRSTVWKGGKEANRRKSAPEFVHAKILEQRIVEGMQPETYNTLKTYVLPIEIPKVDLVNPHLIEGKDLKVDDDIKVKTTSSVGIFEDTYKVIGCGRFKTVLMQWLEKKEQAEEEMDKQKKAEEKEQEEMESQVSQIERYYSLYQNDEKIPSTVSR